MELKINLNKISSEEFIEEYIPIIIESKIQSNYVNNKRRPIYKYIKDTYKISMSSLIRKVVDSLQFNIYDNYEVISINPNIFIKNDKLISLVKLVDFGNLNIKGTKLFSSSMKWLQDNIEGIYAFYQSTKGVGYGN